MRILLSPAKTFRKEALPVVAGASQPLLVDRAEHLMRSLSSMTVPRLQELMDLSPELAEEVAHRHAAWGGPFHPGNSRTAVLAFHGEVYRTMGADRWNASDLDSAQERLRILSGLYGVLRPLDLIQLYRLEMGIRWSPDGESGLYAFWGDTLARLIDKDAGNGPIVNLSSQEYFKAIDHPILQGKVTHIDFKEERGGAFKLIGTYAKTARGRMARFLVQERIESIEDIKSFSEDGYGFHPGLSRKDTLTFTRHTPDS